VNHHNSKQYISVKNTSGQAAIIAIIIITAISLTIGANINSITIRNQKNFRNIEKSMKSYYTAEAAIEDSLLRVIDTSLAYVNNEANSINLNGGTASTTIDQTENTVKIFAHGNIDNIIRNLKLDLKSQTTGASFNYGVHVGAGGLEMAHSGGIINGDLFSNGTVFGSGTITGTVIVASDSNKIDGITINVNAQAHTCENANITGDLTYSTSGSSNCTVGGSTLTQSSEIEPKEFPIIPTMISDWKSDAQAGGILTGDQIISSHSSLGPIKIDGNLTINIGIILTINGTIWVTGTITINNLATVQLHESYGDLSGMFIGDGTIDIGNNVILQGASSSDSYLLLIGTSSSLSEANPAINVNNNANNAILFTPNGLLAIQNNADVIEATGYKLLIKKATVTYDIGLINLEFSTGPTGGWSIVNWEEVN